MRRVVATLIVAVASILFAGSGDVSGQAGCSFVRGFATLRDLVGAQKVGACIEDEHFNGENGNAEQQTAGGLLVWRKADNFTAFTDGGTTWVNGPDGLQSRPNAERFSWESDPVSTVRAAAPPSPPPPPPISLGSAPAPAASPALVLAGQGTAGQGTTAAVASGASASGVLAQAAPTATSTPTKVASTATATKVTTPTATPNPVQVKFSEKPDNVESGNEAHFEVETNAKKGTCVLTVTYRNTAALGIGQKDIDDDGRCSWKFLLAADVKTGKATASVGVTANGGAATIEDSFEVKKGDTAYAGDIDVELKADKVPDEVSVGEEFEVSVDTNLKKKGTCDMSVTWPKIGVTVGENKAPDDKGRCSWKMTAPTTIPKSGTATLTVVVRKSATGATGYKMLTKEFDVKK